MEQKPELDMEGVGEIAHTSTESENGLGVPVDENELTAISPPPNGVKYRVEFRNFRTGKIVHSFNTDGLDYKPADTSDIFDIVTTFSTTEEEFGLSRESKENDKRTPLVTDNRKRVAMHIRSPAIIHALRSIVKYYPGQSLLGETIIIPEPYAILVHHEKELKEYGERCHPSRQTHPVCPKEKSAYHEIKILQDFLEQTVMPAVRLERERNEKGLETFDMLWLRLQPGKTIRSTNAGSEYSYGNVVEYVRDGGGWAPAWNIGYWTVDYNGTYLGTRRREAMLVRFEGERKIVDSYLMSDSAFKEPLDKSVKDLVEQGETFYRLLSKNCQGYKGTTACFPYIQVEGLVMVDMKKYYTEIDRKNAKPTMPVVTHVEPEKAWVTDCSCIVCSRRKEERSTSEEAFGDYHGIYPEDNDRLTPHQYFLLPEIIWAFVFKTRTWEQLYVKSFQDPKFQQDLIDKLVMDPARIKTLKALASSYIRENQHGVKSKQPAWSADFIQGKGRGQIILLHGPPGVGKTCTAECIAEYTKRPLMILTSSDIGADPEKVEKNLSDGFKTASDWGAVLLIDEADVFMEERSTNDLNRNCLVAGFLRALEFYDGILFLTTNRIGAFDDAFISRIHVKLYYGTFTPEERQRIWQNFSDKLIKDRGSSFRISIDAKEYIKSKQIKELKWNGREIRNAFQTAVALAEYDGDTDEEGKILLKDTHLSSIVDMSRDFKEYLDRTHHSYDESKRATIKGIRHDEPR